MRSAFNRKRNYEGSCHQQGLSSTGKRQLQKSYTLCRKLQNGTEGLQVMCIVTNIIFVTFYHLFKKTRFVTFRHYTTNNTFVTYYHLIANNRFVTFYKSNH